MLDRRKLHRDRTYLGGRIAFNSRCSTFDCLVRNLSQDGAKISFSDSAAVPSEFDVTIDRKGESRRARIVWRDQTQAGIRFLPADDQRIVSIETAVRIRKLEAERDALARRISQLSEPA